MEKKIKGFENYLVDETGNIKNAKTNNILIGGIDTGGYRIVTLCKNSKGHTKTVHRLVAEAFLPNPLNLPCINHKDENKRNNHVNNLEWCTYQYNNTYGTFIQRRSKSRYKKIKRYDLDGNYIDSFEGVIVASKTLNISRGNITSCLYGRRKSAGGYKWRFKNEESNTNR